MSIRTSVKAVVVQDGRLLALESVDKQGVWFLLPGGGQEHGETLHQALQRECLEEIGTEVEIGPLRFVRDYIGSHHEFADTSSHFHQVELMFACRVPARYVPTTGHAPDGSQTGVRWLPLAKLHSQRFYPKTLISHLTEPHAPTVIYLGDVN